MIENAHSTPGPKNRAMQSSSVTFVFCFTPRSNFLQLVLSCPASFDTLDRLFSWFKLKTSANKD